MTAKNSKLRLEADSVTFKVKDKVILNDVSLSTKSGQLFAIIGQTGSGKTTFLNMIAGRQTPDKGSFTLNGEVFDKRLRRRMAFVQQHDVFFSQLTLKETLEFTASLRISEDVPRTKKLEIIDVIVKSLRLEKCLNTVIGDIFTKGLSGGEKKRASIACELLTNPDLIFLDEPTSGLDSSTAQSIMEFLQRYAMKHNKLVILSIHQPSSKIYHMFHSLLILKDGRTAFNGKRKKVIPYFTELGCVFDIHHNPADFIMEFVADADEEQKEAIYSKAMAEKKAKQKCNALMQQTKFQVEREGYATDSDTDSLLEETRINLLQEKNIKNGRVPQFVPQERNENKWATSWWTQVKVLSWRSLKQAIRVIKQGYTLVQAVFVAVLCSLIYFRVGLSLKTSRDVFGLLFFYVGYWTFLPAMTVITSYGAEHKVIVKERASGAYRLSAYFLGRMISDLPETLLLPGIMFTVFFWIGDFGGPAEFFASLIIMYIQAFCCFGLGLLLAVMFNDVRMSITTLFCYLISTYMLGGFFSRNVPFWMKWIKYCSIFYYPYSFTISLITANIPDMSCNSTEAETFQGCADNPTAFVTSSDILEEANVYLPPYIFAIVIIAYTSLIRLVAYIVLRLKDEKII